MNYFELFDIPVQLKPDNGKVRKKFLELSRKYHPDYFVQQADELQQEALEQAAQLNKAYKVLSNEDAVIKYVLQERGLMEEEEKFALPPDFLMEMMELNEALAEAQMDGDENAIAKTKQQLSNLEKEIYEPVKDIVEHYQEGVTSEKELLQVKSYYYKKKYLQRIAQQVGQKL
jgi:molecular chaperone HscB